VSEPRTAIAFDSPAPADDKGVGETGSAGFIRPVPQGRAGWNRETDQIRLSPWRDHLPSGLRFGYLADALGDQSIPRSVRRAYMEPRALGALALGANAGGQARERTARQLDRVQVWALHTRPPKMHPSSLIVFASCNVRLPE
jgi:hypothetical protein